MRPGEGPFHRSIDGVVIYWLWWAVRTNSRAGWTYPVLDVELSFGLDEPHQDLELVQLGRRVDGRVAGL